ncbi:MAG: hypothetical protein ABL931_05415 [Usitatibacteraceae bacterium]
MDDAEGRGASLMHGAASLLLLAFSSASPCQTTPASPLAPTVKVGKEFKKTTGLVKELQNGDVSCVIVLQDEDGKEFMESGDFDICFQKPSLIGKRVRLRYEMASVMAASCQGDVDCKKTDRIALVVQASIIDAKAAAK